MFQRNTITWPCNRLDIVFGNVLNGYSLCHDHVALAILAKILAEGAHSWRVEDESILSTFDQHWIMLSHQNILQVIFSL